MSPWLLLMVFPVLFFLGLTAINGLRRELRHRRELEAKIELMRAPSAGDFLDRLNSIERAAESGRLGKDDVAALKRQIYAEAARELKGARS